MSCDILYCLYITCNVCSCIALACQLSSSLRSGSSAHDHRIHQTWSIRNKAPHFSHVCSRIRPHLPQTGSPRACRSRPNRSLWLVIPLQSLSALIFLLPDCIFFMIWQQSQVTPPLYICNAFEYNYCIWFYCICCACHVHACIVNTIHALCCLLLCCILFACILLCFLYYAAEYITSEYKALQGGNYDCGRM